MYHFTNFSLCTWLLLHLQAVSHLNLPAFHKSEAAS